MSVLRFRAAAARLRRFGEIHAAALAAGDGESAGVVVADLKVLGFPDLRSALLTADWLEAEAEVEDARGDHVRDTRSARALGVAGRVLGSLS